MLLSFIQDYCTKATASYTPRLYLCLQRIKPPSPKAQLLFRGNAINSSFNPDDLTETEMKRFFKAFLLFELNCKVIKVLGTPSDPSDSRNNLPTRDIHTSENEAIHCIQTYVRSLYGACLAQCGDGFLPNVPDESSLEPGLIFPDTFCFDPDLHAQDRGLFGNYNGEATSHLAKLGLEPIAKFTLYSFGSQDGKTSFNERFDELLKSKPHKKGPYKHVVTRIQSSDDGESPMYQRLSPQLFWSNTLQLNIYQQRAWVFFDDDRLHPSRTVPGPHFPTQDFLFHQADKLVWHNGWVPSSDVIRSRTRSQKWQNEYAHKKRFYDLGMENKELQRDNSILRRDNEILRQAIAGNPELSTLKVEDPMVLRKEARRLLGVPTICDLATVARYTPYIPFGTRIICKQSSRLTHIDVRRLEGTTPAEIEPVIRG